MGSGLMYVDPLFLLRWFLLLLSPPLFGMTAIPNGGIFAITNIFRKSVIPNGRIFGITMLSTNLIFTTTGGFYEHEYDRK